jgi:dihydroflavonol-4-reductase
MIVVTGGTGLLGGHLLLELINTDDTIRVIIRKDSKPEKVFSVWKHYHSDPQALLKRFQWYPADMINMAEMNDAIENASQVYHCAGFVSFDPGKKRKLWETNVNITANLVNTCLAHSNLKLVHVSSVATINNPGDDTQSNEQSSWLVSGKSGYAATKTRGELEVWRGITEGLNAVIVNPTVILGPGAWDKSSARIFDILYRGLRYYTTGITGYVDVRDVVRAMIELMHSNISGERFVLNAVNLTFKELFEKISLALKIKAPSHVASPFITSLAWKAEWLLSLLTGHKPRVTRVSARSAHARQEYSSEKICTQLGFSFRDINETIRDVAECYLKEKNKHRSHKG